MGLGEFKFFADDFVHRFIGERPLMSFTANIEVIGKIWSLRMLKRKILSLKILISPKRNF